MAFTEKEQAFLRELTELSRKHSITVLGCGCCGSPILDEHDCSDPHAGYGTDGFRDFTWLAPGDYEWEEHKSSIVK